MPNEANSGRTERAEGSEGSARLARALLAVFAIGIPLDVMLSNRLGSSSAVLGSLLVVGAGLQLLMSSRVRPFPTSLSLLVAFTAWSAVSVLWARDSDAFQVRIATGVQLLAFVLLGWQIVRSPRDIRAMLAGFLIGCVIAAIQAWGAVASGESVNDTSTRYTAEAFNPNDMAVTLAIGIPVALYLAFSARGGWKALLLAYVPLALSTIAISGSRGGTLTAAVALVCGLAWTSNRSRPVLVLVLAMIGLSIVVGPQLIPERSLARIFTIREQMAGGTLGDRTQIWRAGMELLAKHPILGIGVGNFPTAIASRVGFRIVAHNTLLSIAVELGIPGVLLFFGALALAVRSALHVAGDERRLALALAVTWIVGTGSLTWEHRKTTWFVLLTIAALGRCATAPRRGGARWRRAPEIAGGTA